MQDRRTVQGRQTVIGVGRGHWFGLPLPPNRTCGSPAYGSPVGGSPPSGLSGCGAGGSKRVQTARSKVGVGPASVIEPPSSSVQGRKRVDQAEPFASFAPLFEGRQHALAPHRRFHPRPSGADVSGLRSRLVGRHWRRCGFLCRIAHAIHLPASLGSTGITPLPRYYGRSDSCMPGSSASLSINTTPLTCRSPRFM